jgi:hypothetical protein
MRLVTWWQFDAAAAVGKFTDCATVAICTTLSLIGPMLLTEIVIAMVAFARGGLVLAVIICGRGGVRTVGPPVVPSASHAIPALAS